jgi:hypothetical protein
MHRFKSFLATFYLLLVFCGYELVTMLFLSPSSQNTQLVTIPYRGFTLLIGIVLLIIAVRFKNIKVNTYSIHLFFIYCFFFLIRMVYDIHISSNSYINDIPAFWLVIFSVTIFPIIITYKTFRFVRIDKLLWWYLICAFLTLLLSVFKMEDFSGTIRQSGNVALNPITYSNLALSTILLSIYILFEIGISKIYKLLVCITLLFGFYCLFIAGSRGPLLSLFIILTIWSTLRSGKISGFIFTMICAVFILIFLNEIISLIGEVSPILESRFSDTLREGNTDRRGELGNFAKKAFLDSPIYGKQFAIFEMYKLNYPHNLFLEGFMALGIGGFLLFFASLSAFIKACRHIFMKKKNTWLSLLLFQYLISSLISGTIYFTPLFSVTILLVLISDYNQK